MGRSVSGHVCNYKLSNIVMLEGESLIGGKKFF
jgi:hypothetical protein